MEALKLKGKTNYFAGLLILSGLIGSSAISQESIGLASMQMGVSLQASSRGLEPLQLPATKILDSATQSHGLVPHQIHSNKISIDQVHNSYNSITWTDNRGVWKVESQGNACNTQNSSTVTSNVCQ